MLKILAIEDVEADTELQRWYLQRSGIDCSVRRVETESEFVSQLAESPPDLILSDFTLPGFDGMSALRIARQRLPDTPFIFVSGTLGEEQAIESMKEGATDYVLKDHLERLAPAVHRALDEAGERSARRRAEQELRDSESRFRLFMDHLPGVALIRDAQGRYTFLNRAAAKSLGGPGRKVASMPVEDCQAPEFAAFARDEDRQVLDEGSAVQSVRSMPGATGMQHWLTTSFPLTEDGGAESQVGIVAIDITDRIRAEEALLLRDRAIEASLNPILIVDSRQADMPIIYVNPAFERVTGYSRAEAMGRNCSFLQGSDRNQPELEKIRSAIREQHEGRAVLRNYRKDGRLFWIDLYVAPVRDPQTGTVTHFVGVQYDITEIKRYQEELEHQATHDALTGLANRNLFNDRLYQGIVQARRYTRILTVAFIDLDHFKLINDSLGHSAGDEVLKLMAERINACVREGDTVARLGGDEFVVLLQSPAHEESNYRIAQRMIAAIATPFTLQSRSLKITGSIGLSVFPRNGADADTLLRNADAAMYRAKEIGRNQFQFYSQEMNADISGRLSLESGLWHALDRNELVLHYQPQFHLASGNIIGIEALIRWDHPERGLLPPAHFISLAEENGLITPIGDWVARTACAQNKALQDAGLPAIRVAINLSARQFRQTQLVESLGNALRATGLEARYLELEMTESMVMHDVDAVLGTLQELAEMGMQLSVDDFGTGYSSLSYLKRFPVDRLKIDKTFVHDLLTDPDDAAITRAVIGLAHALGIKVIAEGVETAEQLQWLRANGCDEAQGYYFSEPLPSEALVTFLYDTLASLPSAGD